MSEGSEMKKYVVYYNTKAQKGLGRYEVHTPECSHYKFSQGLYQGFYPSIEKAGEFESKTAQEVADEFFNNSGGDFYTVVSPCAKPEKVSK